MSRNSKHLAGAALFGSLLFLVASSSGADRRGRESVSAATVRPGEIVRGTIDPLRETSIPFNGASQLAPGPDGNIWATVPARRSHRARHSPRRRDRVRAADDAVHSFGDHSGTRPESLVR